MCRWPPDAGEWLERQANSTALVHAHTALGDTMLPWAIALTVVALVVLARELLAARARRQPTADAAGGGPGTTRTRVAGSARSDAAALWGGRGVSAALAVIAVVVAVGSLVTVYRIGDSGAWAAWTGRFSQQAQPPPWSRLAALGMIRVHWHPEWMRLRVSVSAVAGPPPRIRGLLRS